MAKKIKIENEVKKNKKNVWKYLSIIFISLFIISCFISIDIIFKANRIIKSKENEISSLKNDLDEVLDGNSLEYVKKKLEIIDDRLYFTRFNYDQNIYYKFDCIMKLDDGYFDKAYKDFYVRYSQNFVLGTCD